MQARFTMRHDFISTRKDNVKRKKMVSKGGEEQKLLCIAGM